MTEKERFQRAFAPLHASPDTLTEVMKMTEQKHGKRALRRAATIGLAAALVLALGSVAYALGPWWHSAHGAALAQR